MSHPFERIPPKRLALVFLGFLVVTLVAGSAILCVLPARESHTLVDLALAGTAPRARAVLSQWTEYDRVRVAFANGLDYLFGFVLFNTVGLACVWGTRVFRASALVGCGLLLAWLCWASVILDIPENISYLLMVFGTVAEPWPIILVACVVFRSTVFFMGVFYAEVATVVWLFHRISSLTSSRAS